MLVVKQESIFAELGFNVFALRLDLFSREKKSWHETDLFLLCLAFGHVTLLVKSNSQEKHFLKLIFCNHFKNLTWLSNYSTLCLKAKTLKPNSAKILSCFTTIIKTEDSKYFVKE